VRLSICACAVLISLLFASHVVAQDSGSQPRVEIKMIVGASDFGTDDESYPHFVVGAATRIRISRHWSIEPEFSYMRRSANDEDYVVQPNVVYEFHPRGTRVVPYLIGGVGIIRHQSVFHDTDFVTGAPITYDTSYKTWSASAGGGLKVFISKRLFVAPEARLGREPTARATVSIGYVFPVQD
jgi:outer membrane protein with beta-barrel domain